MIVLTDHEVGIKSLRRVFLGTTTDTATSLVCAKQTLIDPDNGTTMNASTIAIAGEFSHTTGGALDPKWTRLKTSNSLADREKEGLRLVMNGGKYENRKQKAIIEFICLPGSKDADRRRDDIPIIYEEEDDDNAWGDDANDGDNDDDKSEGVTDDGHGGKLKFIKWEEEEDAKVLRLEWDTKYACEDATVSGDKSSSGHWGFFTWFIIMLVDFLSVSF